MDNTMTESKQSKKPIIHKAIYKKFNFKEHEDEGYRIKPDKMYLCNQAVKPTKEKMNMHWKHVTCKNCLKQKEKYMLEKYGRKNASKLMNPGKVRVWISGYYKVLTIKGIQRKIWIPGYYKWVW